jgi:AcrR family transcriptional regulator
MKRPRKEPRVRRNPDEAKALILDAAERVFGEKGPDAAGLKDVATRAGISHALITYYFGTYDQLVIAVLQRRALRGKEMAAALVEHSPPGPEAVMQFFIGYLSDPLQVRLITWALLTGKDDALMPLAPGALKPIMEGIGQRRRAQRGRKVDVKQLELDLTVALAAGFGFAIGRELFGRALDRPSRAPDAFAHRLANMLDAT